MKKILLSSLFITVLILTSCGDKDCKECSGCLTKATATLCEDDFEKTSDYNDKLDDMVSDGCSCKDK